MADAIETLAAKVGTRLQSSGALLATAESCTGGWVSQAVTAIAGSSGWFERGFVAYSNEAKQDLLGVRAQTVARHGAVSEETAREMARGVRRALGSDVGVSVTGIAGPGGGMPGKPVGLTWVALSARDVERAEHYVWDGDRIINKEKSAEAALVMLKEYLESLR